MNGIAWHFVIEFDSRTHVTESPHIKEYLPKTKLIK